MKLSAEWQNYQRYKPGQAPGFSFSIPAAAKPDQRHAGASRQSSGQQQTPKKDFPPNDQDAASRASFGAMMTKPHSHHHDPIPGAQPMTPKDLGQPSNPPPPVPEGFTLPAYAASMPNDRGLIRLACDNPPHGNVRYWAIQDVLVDFADYLSSQALLSLQANFGNARAKLGPLFTSSDPNVLVGKTWRTYPFDVAPEGSGKAYIQNGPPYNDALTFCDDQQTPGTWASDLAAWVVYNNAYGWPQVT